uniref:disease resistance protein RPM1-like n=1 Tax=Erigeron canadensis TaxID=72917 RepID=UPI001CB8A66F|nr:disease resistance protein RPM1-like [Erigeron canadensis]
MIKMEVKALAVGVVQKLKDTLNEQPITKNKVMMHQLKPVKKSLEKLQGFSEEIDMFQMSSNYLCVLCEVADEIEKFAFRVARQRKRFGFVANQMFLLHDLNSCRMLIRKIKKIMSKISCSPKDEAATKDQEEYHHDNDEVYSNKRELARKSSSVVWPISTIPSVPSSNKKCLVRSLTTIPHSQENLLKKKKLMLTYSYNKREANKVGFEDENGHDQCPGEVLAKYYADLCEHSKLCLLYLSLFPKNEDISVRRLIRLWLAEGFVERRCQQPFPEDLVQKLFEDLVDLGMIQITKLKSDNSPKKCRLASILQDYLSPKAQNIGLFYIHQKSECFEDATAPFGVRRMVHDMSTTRAVATNKWARKFDPSNLRSYLSFNRPHKDTAAKEVGILLNRIIKNDVCLLRVLDLEGVNNPTLPDKLGHLCNLKYLGLRRTYLDSLPESVGDLSNLETLDVKHTYVNSLPDSIWKLDNLRHLNLNNISLAMPPSSSSTLVTLWGLVLDEKIPVNEGLGMLLNLTELGIKFQLSTRSQGMLLDWIAKLVNLQSLRLISVDDKGIVSELVLKSLVTLTKLSHLNLIGKLQRLPALYEFPLNVKVLTLSISHLNNDPMETLGKLPCLIVLRLLGDSFMGKRIICHQGGFKKLEVLKFWNLPGLEEWDVEEEAMESLLQLNIRRCHKLKKIPSRLLLKTRPLKDIILEKMSDDFVSRIRTAKSMVTSLTIRPLDGNQDNTLGDSGT